MPSDGSPFEDANAAINQELARANLARLRGDYDLAERQCMELLKKAPHDATVAALLGDVSAEQGKLDEAVQWYEMAVGAGAPTGIEEKLAASKVRVRERDAATTERDIGLAQRTWTSPPVLAGAGVIIMMLLVCAYVAGTYRTPTRPVTMPEQAPLVLPRTASAPPAETPASGPGARAAQPSSPPSGPVQAPESPAPRAAGDADLASQLASGTVSRIAAAISDPRTRTVTLDVRLRAGEEARVLAAQTALAAMGELKDAAVLTIRLLMDGNPVYMADCRREAFDANAHAEHPATEGQALADALLTNEWSAPAGGGGGR